MKRKKVATKKIAVNLFLAAALLMFALSGCTIEHGSDMSDGVLVDSPLGGIDYTSYTYSGTTEADGGFRYFEGRTITFSVGGIILGSSDNPNPIMSLMDLVPGATDVTDPTVTNMARFLQSLDDDNDLTNGIFITQAIRDSLKGMSIDFTLSTTDFEASVADLFSELDQTLISAADAQNHLRESMLFYGLTDLDNDGIPDYEDSEYTKTLTILQTSDMHDHASGYGSRAEYTPLDTTDDDPVKGGYARLATKIEDIRSQQDNKNLLLLDSGDFFMGTIYDMSIPPLALAFFQAMGYDAVTLGNHEFDWSPAGLDLLLNAGIDAGFNVPIVASTMDASGDAGLTALINNGAIRNKMIITTDNGLKIGIMSLEGPNSIQDMPAAAPVTFTINYAEAQAVVDDLRNNDKVDVVVALSHSGIRPDGTGDDADWAENVTGIDIIASGHYHTVDQTAHVVGPSGTIIFSPGSYTRWLANLDITYTFDKMHIVSHTFDFTLIPIDDTIQGDPNIQAMVAATDSGISAALEASGLPADLTPVSSTSFDLVKEEFAETAIGNLSADAIRFTANQLSTATGGTPFTAGIVASGVIRDALLKGDTGLITFSDAYNVLPLGISPWDQSVPGYPLISIYVTGPEIRTTCEISAILSILKDNVATAIPGFGPDVYLNVSGLRYKYHYDPTAAQFTPGSLGMTVWQVSVTPPDDYTTSNAGTPIDLTDTTTLYRIVVDYYALQMMGIATSKGFSIVPKDASGNPIDLSDPDIVENYRIDRDPATEGVQELKEWMGLLQYFQYIGAAYSGQIPTAVYDDGGTGFGRSEAAVPQG